MPWTVPTLQIDYVLVEVFVENCMTDFKVTALNYGNSVQQLSKHPELCKYVMQ